MKIVFIVIDGLGDKPTPQLGNKTPLEAARTPNLDSLAKNGICGQIMPFKFSWQKWPESDTCHLALFGYDPKKYYLGRGPYEVAGIGMEMKSGDVALRANFATVSQNLKIIDRRAGRIDKTSFLIKAISGQKIEGVSFLVKKSFGHRAGLILRGKNLSAKITDADPKEINKKVKKVVARDNSKEAKFTAKILDEFLLKSYQILKNHPLNKKRELAGLLPANFLLVRGAGKFKKTPRFYQKYKLKACCIAGGALYKGIAKILGMKLIKVKGATGLLNTNLRGKFLAVKKAIRKPAPHRNEVSGVGYDFIFCHIKAVDNLAEDGKFKEKKEFIEKIDKNIKILRKLKKIIIVVTGDHSTCSLLKRHCMELLPLLIYKPGIKGDRIRKFGERECKKGSFKKINQLKLISKILKLTNPA
jgi:2,3-bisphosphoglycerate-independent phosphoglycerate mutase